jgi:hypothetical protein
VGATSRAVHYGLRFMTRITFLLWLALGASGGQLGCGGRRGPGVPADAGADAVSGPAAALCGEGSWILLTSGGSCAGCAPSPDSIGLVVSQEVAAEGGAVTDTEGNRWQFDPAACSATLAGDCDASDAIDFDSGLSTCAAICGSCPACPIRCSIRPQ